VVRNILSFKTAAFALANGEGNALEHVRQTYKITMAAMAVGVVRRRVVHANGRLSANARRWALTGFYTTGIEKGDPHGADC